MDGDPLFDRLFFKHVPVRSDDWRFDVLHGDGAHEQLNERCLAGLNLTRLKLFDAHRELSSGFVNLYLL